MNLPPRVPVKIPRVDWQVEQQRVFFFQKALHATWEQAVECPCARKADDIGAGLFGYAADSSKVTEEARPDCPKCAGRGWYFHSPQTIPVMLSSITQRADITPSLWEHGTVQVTTLPENLLAYRDRITLTESVVLYRERRTRAALVDELRYPIVVRALDLQGGEVNVGVLHCYKADTSHIAQPGGELVAGTDFEVTVQGRINWTKGLPGTGTGKAPAVGQRYAVAYYAHPRYVVMDRPHAVRDTFVRIKMPSPTHQPLPVHAIAQLEWLGDGHNG